MFRVTLPSNDLFVTPEQLPRLLANLAETKYTTQVGEFLQTTTEHELVTDATTATLLVRKPFDTIAEEKDQYRELWKQERDRAEKLAARLVKSKGKSRK